MTIIMLISFVIMSSLITLICDNDNLLCGSKVTYNDYEHDLRRNKENSARKFYFDERKSSKILKSFTGDAFLPAPVI